MVADREILGLLDGSENLDAAARALVDAANAGGGEDNITVVLFQLTETAGPALDETVRMPAVEADDEDTLSGLDPIPAVDTAVVPAEAIRAHLESTEEQDEPARSRPRRSVFPLLLLVLLVVAVAVLAIWGLTR
jgi:protein phosphatase